MKTTGRPCDSPSFCANSRRSRVPSTLTWWAVMGVNSPRVDRSAARWNTSSTSNSERMRSSRLVSRIEPTNCCCTRLLTAPSRGFTSRVTMSWRPVSARRSMRPWPISPPAPVMRTTLLRTVSSYGLPQRHRDTEKFEGQPRRLERLTALQMFHHLGTREPDRAQLLLGVEGELVGAVLGARLRPVAVAEKGLRAYGGRELDGG